MRMKPAVLLTTLLAAAMMILSPASAGAADYRLTPAPAAVEGLDSPVLSLSGSWKAP